MYFIVPLKIATEVSIKNKKKWVHKMSFPSYKEQLTVALLSNK